MLVPPPAPTTKESFLFFIPGRQNALNWQLLVLVVELEDWL